MHFSGISKFKVSMYSFKNLEHSTLMNLEHSTLIKVECSRFLKEYIEAAEEESFVPYKVAGWLLVAVVGRGRRGGASRHSR